MTKEIAVQAAQDIVEISGYKMDDVKVIKGVIGFDMSDTDLRVFLHICRHTKLDPLAKQIYVIPRGSKMTIQTSIDGFRLVADRSGCYAPGRPTEYHYNDKGYLLAATSYVKKFAGGTWHEIGEQALLAEYMGTSPFWKKMPSVMLAKVAEARALRRAFPADLSGLYTDDEMDQAANRAPVVPSEPQATVEPTISKEEWDKLDGYLNGHDELRQKLKELCKVDDLRNIKISQKDAVNAYAKSYMQRQKDAKETS